MMIPAQTVPHFLLPEALDFLPQLLLDDIINVANNTVTNGVNGMEEFLQRWADTRAECGNRKTVRVVLPVCASLPAQQSQYGAWNFAHAAWRKPLCPSTFITMDIAGISQTMAANASLGILKLY